MEAPELPNPSPIEVARRLAAVGGLLGLTPSIAAWVLRPDAFWHAYGFAWLLGASVTLGCLLLALLTRAGRWDPGVRAVLRAGSHTTYLVAMLAVPLVLSAGSVAEVHRSWLAVVPLDARLRWLLVGPALAALSLSLATLASLARHEPLALSAAGERLLRLCLVAALALDALTVWRIHHAALQGWRAIPTGLEMALAAWLLLPRRLRRLAPAAVLALLAGAAHLHGLVPAGALLRSDPAWLPRALDALLLVTLSGLWLALFLWRLDRQPPPPLTGFVEPRAAA